MRHTTCDCRISRSIDSREDRNWDAAHTFNGMGRRSKTSPGDKDPGPKSRDGRVLLSGNLGCELPMTTLKPHAVSLTATCKGCWRLVLVGLCLAAPSAAAEQTVTIGTPILTPNGANPYQALGYPAILAVTAVFDPLAVIDAEGRVQPWLAVDWSSDDATNWLITLRENVVFSNGRPLDASVLVESVAHMKTLTGRSETVGTNLADIAAIEAVSERQVLVTLEAPDPVLPIRFSLWRIPEPETFRQTAAGAHQAFAAGTGPFKPIERSADQIILVADPTSWRTPKLDRLVLVQISDQMARAQALASGDIDIALEMGVGGTHLLKSIGARVAPRRVRSVPYVGFALEHVGPTPLDDQRVRQALNYAVNKELIADVIFQGLVEPIGQLALPGAAGYDPTLEPYPYNPAKASQLLQEAGYPDGFSVTLRTSTTVADALNYTQQIAADLAAVNVHARLQLAPQPRMTMRLFHGKLDAELFSIAGRGLAPARDYRFRACLGLVGRFKPFFCDDVANDLIAQARSSATYEEMERAMRAALRREHDNPPGIFLWDGGSFDGVAAHVRDFQSHMDFIELHKLDLAPK